MPDKRVLLLGEFLATGKERLPPAPSFWSNSSFCKVPSNRLRTWRDRLWLEQFTTMSLVFSSQIDIKYCIQTEVLYTFSGYPTALALSWVVPPPHRVILSLPERRSLLRRCQGVGFFKKWENSVPMRVNLGQWEMGLGGKRNRYLPLPFPHPWPVSRHVASCTPCRKVLCAKPTSLVRGSHGSSWLAHNAKHPSPSFFPDLAFPLTTTSEINILVAYTWLHS